MDSLLFRLARYRVAVAATMLLIMSMIGGAAAATAESPAVAGTTVLTPQRSATQRVRVPADAVLDLTPTAGAQGLAPKALQTSGGSGFVGFLLRAADDPDGLWVVGARLPYPHRDGDTTVVAVAAGKPAAADRPLVAEPELLGNKPPRCQRCRVPAGVYDLQLITGTNAEPATVAITFEGLAGEARLSPSVSTQPHGAIWRHANPRTLDTYARSGMAAYASLADKRDGILLSVHALHVNPTTPPVAASSVKACRSIRSGSASMCDESREAAGPVIDIAGSGALEGRGVETAWATASYSLAGKGTYQAEIGVLWVPTTLDAGSSDVAYSHQGDDVVDLTVVND